MKGAQEQTKKGIKKLQISRMVFCPVTSECRDVDMDCRGCEHLVRMDPFYVCCDPEKEKGGLSHAR